MGNWKVLGTMISVAVCDENRNLLSQMGKWLFSIGEKVKQYGRYENIQSLMKALRSGKEVCQLVLLAIEWEEGKPDGLEAARQIYRFSPETKILWMTEHPEQYIQQVFLEPVNLLGLMAKPVDRQVLEQYLQKLDQEGQRNAVRDLLIRNRGVAMRVRFEEILYLESSGHVVAVRTRDDKYRCYGRLETFLEQLPEYFVQCHKSYIVNMREIIRLEKGGILMEQGMVVPVSKSRYSGTKEQYFRFMEQPDSEAGGV